MVDGDGVPERVRRVLDDVMRGLRVDRPDRASLWRDATDRIGRGCRERLDAPWWEALCGGCAFDLGHAASDRQVGGVQFVAFGGFAAVPSELRQEYPRSTLPRDFPDEIAELWSVVARDESLHPALQARMADLMWARRDRTGGLHWFEIAVDAYVHLSERDDWHIVDRCMGLRRAITIAAKTPGAGLMDRCNAAAQRMIRASLDQGKGQFGIVHPLLAALISHQCDVGGLLDDAIGVYRADPKNHHSLLDLVATVQPDQSADVARRQIEAFEQHAASQTGLGARHWLHRALEVAQQHRDEESVNRLLVNIEHLDYSEDMQSVVIENEIESAEVEAFSEQFAVGGGLANELEAWSVCCPLEEESRARADAQAQIGEFLFLQLGTQVVLGDDGTFREIAPGSQEQVELVMHQGDALQLQIFGSLFGGEALGGICERNADELDATEALFACPWIDQDDATCIAKALTRWRDGELDRDDLRSLTPCVESTVRAMLRLCRQPVTRLARQGSAQTEPMTLGTMLNSWEGLPEPRRRYFSAVLTNPQVMRIRNLVAHGADADLDVETSFVLIFHVLCCLRFSTLEVTQRQMAT